MGESRPPLRAAFWAICAALLLMLLATLSDPYRVRQSMLASRSPDRSGKAVDRSQLDPPAHADRMPIAALTPTRDAGGALESHLMTRQAAVPKAAADQRPERAPITSGARAHVVSSADGGNRHVSRPFERPAMPILAPGELTGPTATGRFEELPPPPELDPDRDVVADRNAAADGIEDVGHAAERALQRLQLETELLTLRHDLNRSRDSRQIEQIQHLQQQQSRLLDRQQQTAERLEQLASQLAAQSARVDRWFEMQTQVTPRDGAGRISSATEADLSDAPRFEQTIRGTHRLSLVIESDDVAGILERLSRWSSATALEQAAPAVTRSTCVEPQPRYLAPPPEHSDPTPLSDLPCPTEAVSPGVVAPSPRPVTGGPVIAAPAICR